MATNNLMRVASLAIPGSILSSAGIYIYQRRKEYLRDPVLQRGLLHLRKDQRVADFCGDNIKPGWMVSKEKKPGENWVKYSLNVQGTSGKLKTVLIGDYLTHLDLNELEMERN